jgi:predicted transcriptional regulator
MIQRVMRQFDKEERDLHVLEVVVENQPIGIRRIAAETDLDEHKVRHSLRMLERDGLVESTPQGAVTPGDVGARIESVNDGLDALAGRLEGLKTLDHRTKPEGSNRPGP